MGSWKALGSDGGDFGKVGGTFGTSGEDGINEIELTVSGLRLPVDISSSVFAERSSCRSEESSGPIRLWDSVDELASGDTRRLYAISKESMDLRLDVTTTSSIAAGWVDPGAMLWMKLIRVEDLRCSTCCVDDGVFLVS